MTTIKVKAHRVETWQPVGISNKVTPLSIHQRAIKKI